MYGSYAEGTYSNAYIISSQTSGEFGYRSSWINNQIGYEDYTNLGAIIGGGNKDVEFALMFRQFFPADAQIADTTWSFDQVFGPNYSNSAGLMTGFSSYVDEELIIGYSQMPQAVIANPWAQ